MALTLKSKVHNNGTEDYAEKVDGKLIAIKAGGYTEMGRREAIAFLGSHPGHYTDGPKKGSTIEKPLSVEHPKDEDVVNFVSQLTGEVFPSEVALHAHLNAHKSLSVLNDVLEKRQKDKATTITKEKVYVCPECDREFSGTGAKMLLGNHMKGHKHDTPRPPNNS